MAGSNSCVVPYRCFSWCIGQVTLKIACFFCKKLFLGVSIPNMSYLLLKTKIMVPCHSWSFKFSNFRIIQKLLIIRTAGELLRCFTCKINGNILWLYHVMFCQFGMETLQPPCWFILNYYHVIATIHYV